MSLGRAAAIGLVGMDGHLITVEAHLAASLPALVIVGLPDAALNEARDRVRAAIVSSRLGWPQRRITVNLSPATLPKAGSLFDLGIAVAILGAAGAVSPAAADRWVFLGELGLDGSLRGVRGVLPAVAAAVAAGRPRVVVPAANRAEAQLVPGAEVVAATSLARVAVMLGADAGLLDGINDTEVTSGSTAAATEPTSPPPDMADVIGQPEARAALEVAAAGAHHLLMVGPPGVGKTMLAARLPSLLPDLSDGDAVEVTAIHSVAGTLDAAAGLIRRPPFEAPHHSATAVSLVGGGSGIPRPGAVSRAHRGILFLDEAPEFAPAVLQCLRQPLERGHLELHRAAGTARYPARFQLVLAANPCPCGRAGQPDSSCTCTPDRRRRYFGRLSGPLLDRVDLQVELPLLRSVAVVAAAQQENSAVVAVRVAAARAAAAERLSGTGWSTNAEVSGEHLRRHLHPGHRVTADLDRALDSGLLSLRGVDRVIRVAWTLADLAGRVGPSRDDVSAAVAMRTRTAVR